jgi:hypothetical protein
MTKTIESLFYYGAIVTDFLFLAFLLFFGIKSVNRDIKVLGLYTCISIIINLGIDSVPRFLKYSTWSFYTFQEQLAFSLFLLFTIRSQSWKRKLIISCVAFFIFLLIYNILFSLNYLPKPKAIDSIPIGVETIIVLIFSFYYLFEQTSDIGNGFIYSRHHFWIVLGFTIYLAGSFFIYIFAGQVESKVLHQYWFITNVFYMVKNILFIIGLWIFINQKKSTNTPNHTYYPSLN